MDRLKLPIVIVNFKTYESSVGNNAIRLAKICEESVEETGKSVAICVPVADIYRVSSSVSIPVFSEHVDPDDFGAHTGEILVSDIKDNGAIGSLINHSEDRYRMDLLEASIKKLKNNEMMSIVCANNDELAEALATFEPDFIAVEPPELIGGEVSVTDADPNIVVTTVKKVHKIDENIPVLCGAGIKNGKDVKKAIELGCAGVLVASGITKASDPKVALLDLLSGI
jgi:triosephosphate isomerase